MNFIFKQIFLMTMKQMMSIRMFVYFQYIIFYTTSMIRMALNFWLLFDQMLAFTAMLRFVQVYPLGQRNAPSY